MIYSATITTGKAGDADSDITTVLSVNKGLIYRVEVEFPPGCCGLLEVRIMDGSYQVWPSSDDDSLHSDGYVIGFDDCYLKMAAPFEFRIKTKNKDETWSHSVQVRIGMVSTEAFMSRYMPSVSWDKMQDAISEAVSEQEAVKAAAIERMVTEFRSE